MRLSDFIESQHEAIMSNWEAFAATRLPWASTMDALALRDHAPQILLAIAADLRMPQTVAEQTAKSHGVASVVQDAPHTAAETHGALRARSGFSMMQLVAEFRALRASVLRLWAASYAHLPVDSVALSDVGRFNEAIDQAVAESVNHFTQETERARLEREQADRALTLSRARLGYATRLSRVGFWYCDLPFDVLQWDEQVKEHFFLVPAAVVTIELFYERIHEDDRAPTRAAIDDSIRSRTPYDIVYRTCHPETGEVKWIRALGGTNYAENGSPVYFDGITVDVTAHKLQERRIAESEARQRGVLSNMEEAFILFDPDFNILEVNDSACRLVQMDRSELLGQSHWERFPGTFESDLGRMYRSVLEDGDSRTLDHQYAFPDGRVRYFEARSFKVDTNVAVLFRDLTERHEFIEALRLADRRKDEFLAMLAHELRNPLAPIRNAAEIVARVSEPHSASERSAAIIRRQSKHLARLLEDLLDVSRITQGRIQLKQETVDIASVLAQAVEINEPQINGKEQRLTVSTAASHPLYVQGDLARLVQCVGNLLSNASKYTGPGGEIKVNLSSADDDVVIEITDSGSGIEADLLPYIFNLFVQSRRTLDRSQGGLGVGLAVVQRLVNLHGGAVAASSGGEGQGATFTIRLPQMQRSVTAPVPEQPNAFPPRRILVVDDNVDAAGSLAMLLELRGHVCLAVHHAREALAEVEQCSFDVAVLDLGLPDIDGYALAGMLRAKEPSAGTRLVALSGYGQPEDRQRTIEAGFDAHLVKPVELDLLELALYGA